MSLPTNEVSRAELERIRRRRGELRSGSVLNRLTGITTHWRERAADDIVEQNVVAEEVSVPSVPFGWVGADGVHRSAEVMPILDDPNITRVTSALNGYFNEYLIRNDYGEIGEINFLRICKCGITKILRFHGSGVRVVFRLILTMQRGDDTPITVPLYSDPHVYYTGLSIDNIYSLAVAKMIGSLESFHRKGSGFRLLSVNELRVNTAVYHTIIGGSSYFETPEWILGRRATINVKNTDNKCFKWSVGRALNPNSEKNRERLSGTLRSECFSLDWSMFQDSEFPMSPDNVNIERFEDANEIRVHILATSEVGKFHRVRASYKNYNRRVTLVYLTKGNNSHYIAVTKLNRLLGGANSKEFYCENCFGHCKTRLKLENHRVRCMNNEPVLLKFPNEGDKISFKNYSRRFRHPIVFYADFECSPKKIDIRSESGTTLKYQKHEPISFCVYGVTEHHIATEPYVYIAKYDGEDVCAVFVRVITRMVKDINKKLCIQRSYQISKAMTQTQKEECESATKCCVCNNEFTEDKPKKHYFHMSWGDYLGEGHEFCIRSSKVPKFTPIFIHNLSGYDSHLFVKQLSNGDGDLDCIPLTDETYISMTKKIPLSFTKGKKTIKYEHEMRFLDSMKFMVGSLSSHVDNLDESQRKHQRLHLSKVQFDKIAKRKGIIPYEWLDHVDKLDKTEMIGIRDLDSSLNMESCSDDDYEFFKFVWSTLEDKSYRGILRVYQLIDVLQLADVFQTFRSCGYENFGLDPVYYFTTPGLGWDAMLKMSGVNLDMLSDREMVEFMESGIRGGVSMVSHRYAKANNPNFDDYDDTKETSHILYLDKTNLYGWAMTFPLPVRNFKWVSEDNLANWRDIPGTYEVDLSYDKSLHDEHNDYPLAPESMMIGDVRKLVPNLNDKQKYVVHHLTLKTYESLGLVITKVHRGVSYDEEDFMKGYVDFNTDQRTKAKTTADKDFFKLMNNAVFGKTMENVRLRVNVKLVGSVEQADKVCDVNYLKSTIFAENLVAVHLRRCEVTLNKPIYVGQAILDISKICMYDFHYNEAKRMWPNCRLILTDTDSLVYYIKSPNPYKDINDNAERLFDTTVYKDHPDIKVKTNYKVLGTMKDEEPNNPISHVVGLRPKLYAYKTKSDKEMKKCKGTKKATVRNCITYEDYERCLFSGEEKVANNRSIRSHMHVVYTQSTDKVALSPHDDKRVIRKDGVSTYAYGHYRLALPSAT